MRYTNLTKAQLCQALSDMGFIERTQKNAARIQDVPLQLDITGCVRTRLGHDVLMLGLPLEASDFDDISLWIGNRVLTHEGVKVVYEWQFGGAGDFHRHLMGAFTHADGPNLTNLCEGFPFVANAYAVWKEEGSDWLYEEHKGFRRV